MLEVGESVITFVDAPVFHAYELPPEAEIVIVVPAQIVVAVAVTVATGAGVTETKILAVSEHPFESVPVTEYPADVGGETEIGFVDWAVLHTYVFPPLPVRIAFCPEQIVLFPLMVIVGVGLTVTFADELAVHPFTSVMVTE